MNIECSDKRVVSDVTSDALLVTTVKIRDFQNLACPHHVTQMVMIQIGR